MKKTTTYDYDSASVMVFEDRPLITVFVDLRFSKDGWVFGKGHAKCHPSDEFDPIFGEMLAASRAYQRAYRKVEKKLLRKAG